MKLSNFFILMMTVLFIQYSAENEEEKEAKSQYQEMLISKRKKHRNAVKSIRVLNDFGKQSEMLSILVKKIFEMLINGIDTLQQTEMNEHKNILEHNTEVLSNISSVIENTAFVADLALNFPKIFHKFYDKKPSWKLVLESAIDLTIRSELIDEPTEKAIELMKQELNLVPRDPNYKNPYKHIINERNPADFAEPQKKKKEKKKRGPGLSGGRIEL